jgi:hypothetical protein
MAANEGQIASSENVEAEGAEDSREAWLSVALADIDGGAAAALATAARGGLLPPRSEP